VAAAGFDSMRKAGDVILANMAEIFEGGSQRFFHKGCNRRWHGVFREDDLALYDAKVREVLPAECAHWLAHGRLDNS
jgi:hypothetical protein